MLLSRRELSQELLTKIMPSLYMNTSRFVIREKYIKNYTGFTDTEKQVINMLECTSPSETAWFFNEKEIRGLAARVNMNETERNLLINKLRSISEGEKYNKASSEANDIAWSILTNSK